MSIMRSLVGIIARRKVREIEEILQNPVEVSEKTLMDILKRHRDTVFGRRFGFESISSPEQYRESVPLMNGEMMQPFIDMIKKDPNGKILTVDPVVWYLQTSGTTGQPKRLPATKHGIKELSKGTMLSWMGYLAQDRENLSLLDGKLITFGASSVMDHIGEIPVGYATGVYSKFQNPIFQRLMNLPLVDGHDVFNVQDMDLKMRCYAKLMVENDVSGLQGITPLWLALIRRLQNEYGPWLVDEYRGTEIGRRVRAAMDDAGQLDVAELWPNLRFLLTTGVSTEPYKSWIEKTLPQAQLWEMYGGSEGYFGGQLIPGNGVQLCPQIVYYEFIPESNVDEKNPETIPLSEVKKKGRYEIVITNSGGYYRYRLSDMVTFSEVDPYTIVDIGRKGRITNLSGEKISDAHVQNAMDAACKTTGAEVMDYTVIAHTMNGIGHYTIAAMFRDDINSIDFVMAYEDAMKASNEEFRVVRETGALGATRLLKLKKSAYDTRVSEYHTQAKPVVLTTDLKILKMCAQATV